MERLTELRSRPVPVSTARDTDAAVYAPATRLSPLHASGATCSPSFPSLPPLLSSVAVRSYGFGLSSYGGCSLAGPRTNELIEIALPSEIEVVFEMVVWLEIKAVVVVEIWGVLKSWWVERVRRRAEALIDNT